MRKSYSHFLTFTTALILFPTICGLAKPTGFSSSNATLHHVDEHLVIQSGHHALINWDSFSLSKDELIRFVQADGTSCVVNKVTGVTRSELLGQLLSNGSVCLINPNGIFIGPDAYIKTAGFIASTLDLVDPDLSHQLRFSGDSQSSIVNQGTIHCPIGDLFLIAKTIDNSGTLKTDQGRQGLLSGTDILISPDDAPLFLIRESEPIDRETLEENPYALAIRHRGTIEASDAYLVANQGLTEVAGQITAPGGTVHVLGDAVHIFDNARIDTSHENSGGTILIGGDYRGENSAIKNAKRTFVEKDVLLKANALTHGNGGKIILWGDESNFYYGHIDIRGGILGGDGGFAEVSGEYLEFRGTVDGFALGKPAILLLDPTDITISGTAAPSGGSFSSGVWTSTASTATIPSTTDANSIQTILQGGTSVTINTSTNSGGPFGNNGSIVWSATNSITWSTANTLTLAADSFISLSSAITSTSATTGFTAINLTAAGTLSGTNSGISVAAALTTTGGNVVLNGTAAGSGATQVQGVLITTGGSIATGAGSISLTGAVTGGSGSSAGILITPVNAISSSSGGAVTLQGTSSASGANSHGLSITGAQGTITTGTLTFQNCSGGSGGASHGISISGTLTTAGSIIATTSINSGTGASCFGFTTSATITTAGASPNSCQITATGRSTSGGSPGVNATGNILATNGAFISLNGSSTGSSPSGSNAISLSATITTTTGSITLVGSATGSSSATANGILCAGMITSTSGDIMMSGVSTAPGNSAHGVSIAAVTGQNSISTSGILTFATCTAGTSGTFTAGHGITMGGTLNVGSLIATNNIRSGTGSGCIGFNSTATISITGASPSSCQITATSLGTAAAGCFGISNAAGRILAPNGAFISLNGTGGTTTGNNNNGINNTGTFTTSTGSITLIGVGSGTAASSSIGVNSTVAITSTSGDVFISGTSTAPGNNSNGVTLSGANAVSTGGTLTLANCSSAIGGTFTNGNGVQLSGTFSAANFIATNNILSGTGTACNGILSSGAIAITGTSTSSCQIAATSRGTAGASNGISLTANGIRANSGAPITLSGTSGPSSAASHGISITGVSTTVSANRVQASTGTITINGVSQATGGVSHGVNIALTVGASPPTAITGTSAPIIITGTTSCPGASSMGVFVSATGWTTSGDTGTVSITGATTGGAATSFPIGLIGGTQTTIATGGPLIFNNLVGISSASGTNFVTITAAGPTSFQGTPISVQGGGVLVGTAAGCPLSVTSTLNLTFAGAIQTPGNTGNGGTVTLTSTNASVIVGINGTAPTGGITTTGGSAGNAGNISITPSGTYSSGLPTGLIQLGGDLIATGGGGTAGIITLNASRAAASTVATIVSSLDGNTISMTGATITFGTYEALTALGDITLTATTMTIGDVVARGNLSINATTANLNLHGDITLLSYLGTFYTSPATHLYGGTGYSPGATTFVPTPPEFGTLPALISQLTFGSQILNFDIPATPPPASIPISPFSDRVRQRLIYELLIADAELSDRLPFQWCGFPAFYFHCEIKRRPEQPALHSYEETK